MHSNVFADHLGYHFITTYDNGFRHTAPINSRHYFEQSYYYHNINKNNNNNYDGRDDRNPSILQMQRTPSPYGQPPVLYNNQLRLQLDHENNEDSAESTVTMAAMIVGPENLIMFCHFDENDEDVFIYVNHDDVAEEDAKREAEQKFGKYLLDLVITDMEKHGIDTPMQPNHATVNTNQIFASLNGQQVMPNQNENQLSMDFRFNQTQHSADIIHDQRFPSQNSQFSTTPSLDMDQQSLRPMQPPLDLSSTQSDLSELLASMNMNRQNVNPTQPAFVQNPVRSDFDQLVLELDR